MRYVSFYCLDRPIFHIYLSYIVSVFCRKSNTISMLIGVGDIKVSELVVKYLENEDIEYIFGIPGEENMDRTD